MKPPTWRDVVRIRAEHDAQGARYLDAYLDAAGNLHIDGQDLGPGTASVSDDGEYEWFQVIGAEHLPRLLVLLGAEPGEGILAVLRRSWAGPRAGALEALLRETQFPVARMIWS